MSRTHSSATSVSAGYLDGSGGKGLLATCANEHGRGAEAEVCARLAARSVRIWSQDPSRQLLAASSPPLKLAWS